MLSLRAVVAMLATTLALAKSVEKAKDWYSYAAAKGSQIALGALRHLNGNGI